MVLCTDDSGVFSTTLSREYAIAAQAFSLDERALARLARESIEYTFLDADGKAKLQRTFDEFVASEHVLG